MLGSAVVTMVLSRAERNMPSMRPEKMMRIWRCVRWTPVACLALGSRVGGASMSGGLQEGGVEAGAEEVEGLGEGGGLGGGGAGEGGGHAGLPALLGRPHDGGGRGGGEGGEGGGHAGLQALLGLLHDGGAVGGEDEADAAAVGGVGGAPDEALLDEAVDHLAGGGDGDAEVVGEVGEAALGVLVHHVEEAELADGEAGGAALAQLGADEAEQPEAGVDGGGGEARLGGWHREPS